VRAELKILTISTQGSKAQNFLAWAPSQWADLVMQVLVTIVAAIATC